MYNINVFYNPWRFFYNPIKWLEYFFKSFKFAYQRATKGYCDSDAWDLTSFYTEIMMSTINELSNTHLSSPMDMSQDEWTETLNTIYKALSNSKEDSYKTLMYDTWKNHLEQKPNMDDENYDDWYNEYLTLQKAIDKEWHDIRRDMNDNKNKALDLIKKYWYDLWD